MGTEGWKVRAPADLLVAERMVRWQLELTGTTVVSAYALRLLSWETTAYVLAKGQGLAVVASPLYLQWRGREHLQDRVSAFHHRIQELQESEDGEALREVVGGKEWGDLTVWAAALGYDAPFPLDGEEITIGSARMDLENRQPEIEMFKKTLQRWQRGAQHTHDLMLGLQLIGYTLVCTTSLFILG